MHSKKKYFAECIGTFIFCLGINFSTVYTHDSQLANLFSIIASLFCAITLTRNISGGHLNAAVTLGFKVDEDNEKGISQQSITDGLFYVLSQIIGAFLACFLSYFYYNKHILSFSGESYNTLGIIYSEAIGTFVFVFNILTQSSNSFSKNSSISTLLIVLGLYTAVNLSSVLSSGCINPSLAVAHLLSRLIVGQSSGLEIYQTLVYIIGQVIGSTVAGVLYTKYYKYQASKQEVVDEN